MWLLNRASAHPIAKRVVLVLCVKMHSSIFYTVIQIAKDTLPQEGVNHASIWPCVWCSEGKCHLDLMSVLGFTKPVSLNRARALLNRPHALLNRVHALLNRPHALLNRSPNLLNRAHALLNRSPNLLNRAHALLNLPHALLNRSPDLLSRPHALLNQDTDLLNFVMALVGHRL